MNMNSSKRIFFGLATVLLFVVLIIVFSQMTYSEEKDLDQGISVNMEHFERFVTDATDFFSEKHHVDYLIINESNHIELSISDTLTKRDMNLIKYNLESMATTYKVFPEGTVILTAVLKYKGGHEILKLYHHNPDGDDTVTTVITDVNGEWIHRSETEWLQDQ